MKLAIAQKDLTMHGMGERVQFTVRADSHIMKVLSNLYEFPEKAMLREYLTNMYDAYVALKLKDSNADFVQPVLVLPSNLSPFLEFRDYGIGMSVQTVMEVYTQYGNSTKNGNNQEVGGFGLGSKTAFCYNNGQTWFIETRWNGKKHTFAAFLDERQIPTLTPVNTEDTDEHNGVTVKVPILRRDIPSVHEAAKEYVPYFPLPLTVENLEIAPLDYSVKTNSWAMLKKPRHEYSREIMVVVGSVPYAFDLSVMDGSRDYPQGLPFGAIDLFLPVGSVDIVPSRDSLQVTDRTKRAVREAINHLIKELPAAVTDTVKAQTNVQDAAKALKDILTLFSFEYSISTQQSATRKFADAFMGITWQGLSLMGYIDHKEDGHVLEVRDYFVGSTVPMSATITKHLTGIFGRLTHHGSKIAQINFAGVGHLTINNETTFVMLNDGVRGPIRIARSYIDSKIIHRNPATNRVIRYGHKVGYIVLLDGDNLTAADVAKMFNIPEAWVLLVSQLKGTLKLTNSSGSGVDNIYRWYNSRWVSRVRVPDAANGPYYYLTLKKDLGKWESKFAPVTVRYMIDALDKHGKNVGELYGIKEDDAADLDDTVWIDAEDAVRKLIQDSLTNKLSEWVTTDTMGWSETSPFVDTVKVLAKHTTNAAIREYVAEHDKMKALLKSRPTAHVPPFEMNLLTTLGIDWKSKVQTVKYFDFNKAEKNIIAAQPMLAMINELFHSRYSYRGWGDIIEKHRKVVLDCLK